MLQKCQPEWQIGKLNGVGGKSSFDEDFNFYETSLECMRREWKEETGGVIEPNWELFCTLRIQNNGDVVHFFKAETEEKIVTRKGTNDVGETFVEYPLDLVPSSDWVIPNLKWLVPMAFLDPQNPITVAVVR